MRKTIPNTHKRILASIPVGADNRSITGKELAATHRMDRRTIQAIIRRLIVEYGVPICASRDINGGFFIPANDTERLEGIRALKSQLTEEEKRVSALLEADLTEYKELLRG